MSFSELRERASVGWMGSVLVIASLTFGFVAAFAIPKLVAKYMGGELVPTQARVVDTYPDRDVDAITDNAWAIRVLYYYEYGGKGYEDDFTVRYRKPLMESTRLGELRSQAWQRYPSGKKITVYVSRRNPSASFAQPPDKSAGPDIQFLVGLVLCVSFSLFRKKTELEFEEENG